MGPEAVPTVDRSNARELPSGLLVVCGLLLSLFLYPAESQAALSPGDEAALTQALQTLAVGFDQSAANTASTILSNSSYTAADWAEFFATYFAENFFTDPLRDFLSGPAFFQRNAAVQEGLAIALWQRIEAIMSANAASLGEVLWANKGLRETLFNCHWFFAVLATPEWGSVNNSTRDTIYANYRNHISTYANLLASGSTVGTVAMPFVGLLRAQVQMALVDILALTPTRKTEIAQAIGLNGRRLDIWNDFSVLIIDNNGLDAPQLNFLYDLLAAVPSSLHTLRFITVRDFLLRTAAAQIIRKGRNGLLNYQIMQFPWGNSLLFTVDRVGGTSIELSTTLPSDRWTHIAVTYDGNVARLYLDGREVHSKAAPGQARSSTDPLSLGRNLHALAPVDERWFRGWLDEVKIYRRGLTASEVFGEANLQPISPADLVAFYQMEETSGTSVTDSAGSGNHGTNFGAASVPGRVGNAFSFNGANSYVEVPSSTTLALSDQMTLALWVYTVDENRNLFSASWQNNIFGVRVGQAAENGFPSDVPPLFTDLFSVVTVHELNHVVDIYSVEGVAGPGQIASPQNPAYRQRKQALLAQAGSVDLQYLRSNVGAATFQSFPQEFFASIANQYFASTQHTLDLALQRFRVGVAGVRYREPLNQFLFFADVHSQGGNTVPFYSIDTNGRISRTLGSLSRDAQGRITGLSHGGSTLAFELDASGNVVNVTQSVIPAGNFLTLIPHSAVGGGYITRLFITNLTATTNSLTINRISQSGALLSSTPTTLQPAAPLMIADSESQRAQPLAVNWFAIASQQPIAASAVFDFEGGSVGLSADIRQAVGALAAPQLSAFTAPVRFDPTTFATIGLALANPNSSSTTVTMKLIDQNGNVVATDSLSLTAFNQTAFDLSTRPAFQGFFSSGFLGSLAVTTVDPAKPVSAVVVGGVGNDIFSLPVVSGTAR